MAERVMAALMRHQEMRVGSVRLQHRCINDDDRAVVVSPCRRGLLRKVRQDVGPDVAIRFVDNSQLPPELESNACPPRRSGPADWSAPGTTRASSSASAKMGARGAVTKSANAIQLSLSILRFPDKTAISRELIKFK
jgi:hypothetical protein